MKKGQMMGQPFIFIMALIIGALILVFGISQLVDFGNLGCKANLEQELSGLRTEIQKMFYETSGSAEGYKLDVPEANYICFIDPGETITLSQEELKAIDEGFATLAPRSTYNVVFIPFKICDTNALFKVEKLTVSDDENPLCVRPNEVFILESKGDHTEVSRYNE